MTRADDTVEKDRITHSLHWGSLLILAVSIAAAMGAVARLSAPLMAAAVIGGLILVLARFVVSQRLGADEDVSLEEQTAVFGDDPLPVNRGSTSTFSEPSSVSVATLPHPRLRLLSPLQVRVERADNMVIVWNESLEQLGYGPSLSDAVEDFQMTVIEEYESLQNTKHRGPGPESEWRQLSNMVQVRA